MVGAALLLMLPRVLGGILYSNLYQFTALSTKSGAYPCGTLIQGAGGVLYGTTLQGGTNVNPAARKPNTDPIPEGKRAFELA